MANYEIGVLAINATALARTLVIFDMVIRYVFMRYAKLPRIEDALTIMSYIYSSSLVPAFWLPKRHSNISRFKTLIGELKGDGDVLEMFFIPRGIRDQTIRKSKLWIQPLRDGYTPRKLRPAVPDNSLLSEQHQQNLSAAVDFGPYIGELRVLFAGDIFIDRRGPALRALLDAFRSDVKGAKQTLEGYMDSRWKTSLTTLNMDYEPHDFEQLEPGAHLAEIALLSFWNPTQLVQSLYNPMRGKQQDGNVPKRRGEFFELLATDTMTIIKLVEIEAIAGEMADTLEQIRYNTLEHHSQQRLKVRAIDATQSTRQYEKIHIRNFP
ncbi:tetratricopeptide-like protein [Colletotrichum tofieldiae]|uniref:Tetratricopeptide-like protein n=1 Tax=Colletotrichum tofieldiae TaxID=708197 RepID=A0A166MDU7_9PEZI|nr:tetratricopeptide-like protein [Colletotrichum tofieldiae]